MHISTATNEKVLLGCHLWLQEDQLCPDELMFRLEKAHSISSLVSIPDWQITISLPKGGNGAFFPNRKLLIVDDTQYQLNRIDFEGYYESTPTASPDGMPCAAHADPPPPSCSPPPPPTATEQTPAPPRTSPLTGDRRLSIPATEQTPTVQPTPAPPRASPVLAEERELCRTLLARFGPLVSDRAASTWCLTPCMGEEYPAPPGLARALDALEGADGEFMVGGALYQLCGEWLTDLTASVEYHVVSRKPDGTSATTTTSTTATVLDPSLSLAQITYQTLQGLLDAQREELRQHAGQLDRVMNRPHPPRKARHRGAGPWPASGPMTRIAEYQERMQRAQNVVSQLTTQLQAQEALLRAQGASLPPPLPRVHIAPDRTFALASGATPSVGRLPDQQEVKRSVDQALRSGDAFCLLSDPDADREREGPSILDTVWRLLTPSEAAKDKDAVCPICWEGLQEDPLVTSEGTLDHEAIAGISPDMPRDPGMLRAVVSLRCCGTPFHYICLARAPEVRPHSVKCPSCRAITGRNAGNQPKGEMRILHMRHEECPLEGHPGGAFIVGYSFPKGRQGPEHLHPGQAYQGTYRMALIPDTQAGLHLLVLLAVAFQRRLVFTVGMSNTTGKEGIVWGGIHHKTEISGTAHGYPDPGYISRALSELAARGVTAADFGLE